MPFCNSLRSVELAMIKWSFEKNRLKHLDAKLNPDCKIMGNNNWLNLLIIDLGFLINPKPSFEY
ncbi:hypothetical protein GCM10022271_09460 [Corallibacter vietnamensis]|uniref:Uncharacterized protein n=1 Tax=Corallibacter vietnamensis TaxID=904130 RepID=A0ABP7H5W7_9FLAO